MLQKTAPKSLKIPATFTIKQGAVFSHACNSYFHVEQGKLDFSLAKNSPSWLAINSLTGLIMGKAPNVYTAKTFHITVIASNYVGTAEWSFYLTVTRDNFDHKVDAITQRYFENKYQQKIEEYYTPELLEYIYLYLEQLHQEELLAQLQAKAAELNITLNQKPSYQDFKKIALLINPELQRQLAQILPSDSPLPHAQVQYGDIQNLFRQGSQPLGVHAIPIFNYLAAPTRHVWSTQVKTIFNAAALAWQQRQQANNVVASATKSMANSIKPQPS